MPLRNQIQYISQYIKMLEEKPSWIPQLSGGVEEIPFVPQRGLLAERLAVILSQPGGLLGYCTLSQFWTARHLHSLEARIQRLVEEGNVSEARNEIARLPFGTSDLLNKWKLLLAEPRGKREKVASGGPLRRNIVWLQDHSTRYAGQWVALKDGQLLGNDRSRLALRSSLKKTNALKGAMFFRIGE